ncbi:hypothetical protein SAMN05216376_1249 [Mameliella alba]|uniref:hypothetical protein n=1 Tax=Mameliella alba TaxID=561184 RepID=UPI00088CCBF8|nr:hypothetical protein [Mameliella alba]OWV41022.1 hypothetical protein CDZ96_25505 [Mameliella alba]PTR33776.1 hypothetical protein LX94_04993 [Mameliella alba]GGF85056.1 hypothetical protein GCM10011319_51260 [Mameliella alba]SDE28253.1 hypothetical protein SAMN05216376_1249 [Mameliella alba]
MTEHPSIATILSQAAALGTDSQDLAAATAEEARGFVLDAIAACIAPRELTILDGGKPMLRLEAAAGQLSRLLDLPDTAPAEARALSGQPLTVKELDAVARALARLLPGDQRLQCRSTPPAQPPDPAHPGIGVDALLRQLGLIPPDRAIQDRWAYLLGAAEEVLIAVADPGQAPRQICPDRLMTATLERQLQALLAPPAPGINLLDKNEILFFTLKSDPDMAIGLAQDGPAPRALVIEAGAMAEVAAFWASLSHVPVARAP